MRYIISMLQQLKWPISYKIGLAFGLVLFCFVVNGLLSIFLLFNIQQTGDHQKTLAVNLEQLQRYELAYQGEINTYSTAIWSNNDKVIQDTFRAVILNGLVQNKLANLSSTSQQYQFNFSALYRNVVDELSTLGTDAQNGNLDQARQDWAKFSPDFTKVSDALADWRRYLESERDTADKTLNDTIFLSVTMIICLTVFSIMLALGLLFLIGRVLVHPINSLQKGLQRMAAGDLDQQIDILNEDEIGELARSFKMAQGSLQQVISGLRIGESLQAVTGQLASVSKQQAVGSAEQVSALAQVGASMQELGRTAGNIAESAVQVADLTSTTVQQIERVAEAGQTSQSQAHQMATVVEYTLSGVERVGHQVEEFSRIMADLNRQSEMIGKVVGLLGSIAEEVHLLALNAAIEASGAGEYGERFRMVAREIKQLANRANQATDEARNLVSGVQQSSREALAQITQGQAEVSSVVGTNSELRQSLQALETSAQQVSESVTLLMQLAGHVSERAEEIKRATLQQRQSSEQVIFSARSAEAVAEQTASATHQIASSSVQLESLANQLNGVLSQVRLAA